MWIGPANNQKVRTTSLLLGGGGIGCVAFAAPLVPLVVGAVVVPSLIVAIALRGVENILVRSLTVFVVGLILGAVVVIVVNLAAYPPIRPS